MNLNNICSELEKMDPQFSERTSDRRTALRELASFTGKISILSLPVLIGSMLKKAYGQGTTDVVSVLNFALTLEYLESLFYQQAVATNSLIPAADLPAFTMIRDNESAHVNFLTTAIKTAGGTPVSFTAANFDYTAHGAYPTVFSNYDTMLAVSQAFEDTGVRAYKGQAANLATNKAVLTAALQIHAVEARHASHVRKIRKDRGATVKPWITGADSGGVPGVSAVYAGEDNTTQAGIQITGINGMSITANAASEAFDEPLTKDAVTAIVKPFFK